MATPAARRDAAGLSRHGDPRSRQRTRPSVHGV